MGHRIGRAVAAAVTAGLVCAAPPPAAVADEPAHAVAGCRRVDLGGHSVARVWNEALLNLIRQVVPAPTVHARNLFHTSVAMWDAWAAYDQRADGYVVTEKVDVAAMSAAGVLAAREAAISYAAYRLLLWRYGTVSDLPEAVEQLDAVMRSLCYRTDVTATAGDEPAALGNRIAAAVIELGRDDGAIESERYVDSSYSPVNDPLPVGEPGAEMDDPNRWQPLSLDEQIAQNGMPLPGSVQSAIGPQWGGVAAFALPPAGGDRLPVDAGPPPRLGDAAGDAEYLEAAVEVLHYSRLLDAADGVEIDIGPGAHGDNPLGSDDGDGHDHNPATGEPYAPNVVARGDFARVIAEFWADGPQSETPPGHWNVLANAVTDTTGFERRVGGHGAVLDPLEWDVKLYFTLNAAGHDAAVAAWGLKAYYDSVRPISMIRWLAGNGQSTHPGAPSYHPRGLPLVDGLIELITTESSAPGQRHEHLADRNGADRNGADRNGADHVGDVAVLAWRGNPEDAETETSGVGWIRAVDWVPYQRPTFVTPAFPGYVSGHSTFSRAAAEVLAAFTGDPFFPGGLYEHTVGRGELLHEEGPTADVTLQWATYFDAADQAGISRLYGGIHISADDLAGRRVGAQCGRDAWSRAQRYFGGTAQP